MTLSIHRCLGHSLGKFRVWFQFCHVLRCFFRSPNTTGPSCSTTSHNNINIGYSRQSSHLFIRPNSKSTFFVIFWSKSLPKYFSFKNTQFVIIYLGLSLIISKVFLIWTMLMVWSSICLLLSILVYVFIKPFSKMIFYHKALANTVLLISHAVLINLSKTIWDSKRDT